jgi:hypothetical protein
LLRRKRDVSCHQFEQLAPRLCGQRIGDLVEGVAQRCGDQYVPVQDARKRCVGSSLALELGKPRKFLPGAGEWDRGRPTGSRRNAVSSESGM